MEGLNVVDYVVFDQVVLFWELLCKLYVNRVVCYFIMGLYEKVLEDSEKVLGLDSESIWVLFCKVCVFNELGCYKEVYECSSWCFFVLFYDESVIQFG